MTHNVSELHDYSANNFAIMIRLAGKIVHILYG